jgi:hypothetical protein
VQAAQERLVLCKTERLAQIRPLWVLLRPEEALVTATLPLPEPLAGPVAPVVAAARLGQQDLPVEPAQAAKEAVAALAAQILA